MGTTPAISHVNRDGYSMYVGPRRITAIPSGHLRDGSPIPRRPYTINREPEPFGEGKSRIFAHMLLSQHPSKTYGYAPVVIQTDSIEDAQK